MELALALIVIVVILFIAMLPVIILLGILGFAFESLLAMIPFALKYLLPPAILGVIVAKRVNKEGDFIFRDYAGFAGIFAGVGLVLLCIVLKFPASPTLPQTDGVIAVTVSYTAGSTVYTETTGDADLIRILCEEINENEYTRSLKELVKSEEKFPEYTLVYTEPDGESMTVLFCNKETIAVKKGLFTHYYKVKEGKGSVPLDTARTVFYEADKAALTAKWESFAEEFFKSIRFVWSEETPEQGYLAFTIPQQFPRADYALRLYMNGMDGYTGGEYTPQPFYIYEEEQHEDTWQTGKTYEFWVTGTAYDRFEFVLTDSYSNEYTFDVLPLLPAECVKK